MSTIESKNRISDGLIFSEIRVLIVNLIAFFGMYIIVFMSLQLLPHEELCIFIIKFSNLIFHLTWVAIAAILALIGYYLAFYGVEKQLDIYFLIKTMLQVFLFAFFLTIGIFIIYFRGVLNNPFSMLVCTAPAFFVFYIIYDKNVVDNESFKNVKSTRRLFGFERFLRILVLLAYMFSVLATEDILKYIHFEVVDINNFWVSKETLQSVQNEIWYKILSYIAFYGSVLSLVYSSLKALRR